MQVPRNSCFVWKEQKLARAGKKTAEGITNMEPVRNLQCAPLVDVKRTLIGVRRSLRKLQCYIQAPTAVETTRQVTNTMHIVRSSNASYPAYLYYFVLK